MLGGASKSTTPSRVTRNAELYTPSVTQYSVPLDAPDVVSLLVQGGTERRLRDRRVVGQFVGTAGTDS